MSCHSTHTNLAALRHARAIADLDDAQTSALFHRLKRTAQTELTDPTVPVAREEARAVITRLRAHAAQDPALAPETAAKIDASYERALAQLDSTTDLPDRATLHALEQLSVEARVARAHLDNLIETTARATRRSPDRMAAMFRRWRRDPDSYEHLASPDPAFAPDPDLYPSDTRTRRALDKLGFEAYLAHPLPVFVYGTLRAGQHNSHLMDGAIEDRSTRAHMTGVGIYGAHRGFPYAVESDREDVLTQGDLVHLDNGADGAWARERLDRLEGFNSDRFSDSHYRRVAREVTYTDSTGATCRTRAWVYLAGRYAADGLREADRIPDGDWVTAHNAYQPSDRHQMYADLFADTDPGDDYDDNEEATSWYQGDIVVHKAATD